MALETLYIKNKAGKLRPITEEKKYDHVFDKNGKDLGKRGLDFIRTYLAEKAPKPAPKPVKERLETLKPDAPSLAPKPTAPAATESVYVKDPKTGELKFNPQIVADVKAETAGNASPGVNVFDTDTQWENPISGKVEPIPAQYQNIDWATVPFEEKEEAGGEEMSFWFKNPNNDNKWEEVTPGSFPEKMIADYNRAQNIFNREVISPTTGEKLPIEEFDKIKKVLEQQPPGTQPTTPQEKIVFDVLNKQRAPLEQRRQEAQAIRDAAQKYNEERFLLRQFGTPYDPYAVKGEAGYLPGGSLGNIPEEQQPGFWENVGKFFTGDQGKFIPQPSLYPGQQRLTGQAAQQARANLGILGQATQLPEVTGLPAQLPPLDASMGASAERARKQFYGQTLPTLSERFANLGGRLGGVAPREAYQAREFELGLRAQDEQQAQAIRAQQARERSDVFNQQLQLQDQLARQKLAQTGQQQAGIQTLLQTGLTPNVQTAYQPGRSGFAQELTKGLAQAAPILAAL